MKVEQKLKLQRKHIEKYIDEYQKGKLEKNQKT